MRTELKVKKVLFYAGTIVMLAGWIIAFLPHATHAQIGLGEDTDHLVHIFEGTLLVLVGLLGMVISSKMADSGALKSRKR